MTNAALAHPAGALHVRPGQPVPHNLRSSRPDWVARLTTGRPAAQLAPTLASLFTLCSHAHRLCAELAVQAAQGEPMACSESLREAHRLNTVREHLRRIALDWPRLLSREAPSDGALDASARSVASCPVFATTTAPTTTAAAPDVAALSAWLQARVFGLPLADWLSAWQTAPGAWLAHWAAHVATPVARLLNALPPEAWAPHAGAPPLTAHHHEAGLRELHAALTDPVAPHSPPFARQPQWQGQCAETGTWTRRHHALPRAALSLATRLGARLAELARLSEPDTEAAARSRPALDIGALRLGPCDGIAWVEMARGLLIHQVVLDGSGPAARVVSCQVLAPTEWNFHPAGAVAQAVALLPAGPPAEPALARWMAAYDPCVSTLIAPHDLPHTEPHHA